MPKQFLYLEKCLLIIDFEILRQKWLDGDLFDGTDNTFGMGIY